jgi:hypothetical protein
MSTKITLGRLTGAIAALAAALAVPSLVLAANEPTPHFITKGVSNATATSGLLEGTVDTEGFATSYDFEYGPTTAYGAKTKPVAVPIPSPPKPVKVGQQATGLQAGYHYRIVGFYTARDGKAVVAPGVDKVFSGGKSSKLRFSVSKGKEEQVSTFYGGAATLTGSLRGLNDAGRTLALQSTPYPFTAPFTTLSGTVVSGRTGSFVFTVPRVTQITEFRFELVQPRPAFSPTVLVHVSPRITIHVRSGGASGLYRIYGTVAPARNGAAVTVQQLLPQKANSKRSGPRPHAVAATVLKRLGSGSSRYSVIVKLTGTYRYRVFVRVPKGVLESGSSANVLIHSPKKTAAKKRGK